MASLVFTTADVQRLLLDELVGAQREEAQTYARQARTLAELVCVTEVGHGLDEAEQFVDLEVAGSCRLGRMAAAGRAVDALRLVQTLPQTLRALAAGVLFVSQAKVLLAETQNCLPQVAARVERRVLAERGAELAPPDLRKRVKKLILTVEGDLDAENDRAAAAAAAAADPTDPTDPTGPPPVPAALDRLARARARRRVCVRDEPDGMGGVWALLTAEQTRRFAADLDTLETAERLADRKAGVERTADQRRADVLASLPGRLLLAQAQQAAGGGVAGGGGAGVLADPRVLLNVHVPMATVLGLHDEPADLEGYGPISAAHVRLLLPDARLRQVIVDGTSGVPCAVNDVQPPAGSQRAARQRLLDMLHGLGYPGAGTESGPAPGQLRYTAVVELAEPQHDPSAALGRLVDVRDVRCDGPGCSVGTRGSGRAHRDHARPWPEGPTAAWNLGLRSASCHRAKHAGWTVIKNADGSSTWTSPLRRTYWRPSAHQPPPVIRPGARLLPPDDRAPRPPPDDELHGDPNRPLADDLPRRPDTTARPTAPVDDDEPAPF